MLLTKVLIGTTAPRVEAYPGPGSELGICADFICSPAIKDLR